MEVQVEKENICINKLIAEKKELIFIQNDMIVPDSKPDILNTINISGNVCVYKKEVMEDKVKIDGIINTYIMYLPDSKEDNIRALQCNIDFSESINIPGVQEGMTLIIKSNIKDMECKVINGRKISIKAGIEFNIKIYSNEEIEILNKIDNITDIQILQENCSINSLIGKGKTSVYAKDTFNIESQDELAEILKVDINLVDKDLKISYNKVLAKAEAEVKIMYLTEDNRIGRVDGKIPVVGFIDIPNISENNICDVNYEIKNRTIRPNPPEDHSIYIELEIEQTCMAFEKKDINLIQDLYSPTKHLEFSQKRIYSEAERKEIRKEFTIKDKVQIAEIEEGNILDVEAIANLISTNKNSSKIIYSGEIELNFIFTKENSIYSRNAKIPFEVSDENQDGTENINLDTNLKIRNTTFEINKTGEITVEIELEIQNNISKNINMNIIDNIEIVGELPEGKDEDYDSLILYIVQPGDSLWKIAKKFHSTVDDLVRMNGIENPNQIMIGQKIYIPKFNKIKKEKNQNEREIISI